MKNAALSNVYARTIGFLLALAVVFAVYKITAFDIDIKKIVKNPIESATLKCAGKTNTIKLPDIGAREQLRLCGQSPYMMTMTISHDGTLTLPVIFGNTIIYRNDVVLREMSSNYEVVSSISVSKGDDVSLYVKPEDKRSGIRAMYPPFVGSAEEATLTHKMSVKNTSVITATTMIYSAISIIFLLIFAFSPYRSTVASFVSVVLLSCFLGLNDMKVFAVLDDYINNRLVSFFVISFRFFAILWVALSIHRSKREHRIILLYASIALSVVSVIWFNLTPKWNYPCLAISIACLCSSVFFSVRNLLSWKSIPKRRRFSLLFMSVAIAYSLTFASIDLYYYGSRVTLSYFRDWVFTISMAAFILRDIAFSESIKESLMKTMPKEVREETEECGVVAKTWVYDGYCIVVDVQGWSKVQARLSDSRDFEKTINGNLIAFFQSRVPEISCLQSMGDGFLFSIQGEFSAEQSKFITSVLQELIKAGVESGEGRMEMRAALAYGQYGVSRVLEGDTFRDFAVLPIWTKISRILGGDRAIRILKSPHWESIGYDTIESVTDKHSFVHEYFDAA